MQDTVAAAPPVASFVERTRLLVDDSNVDCITWTDDGTCIHVTDIRSFCCGPLRVTFNTERWESWTATLTRYGFQSQGNGTHVYYHQLFHRDHPELMSVLTRRPPRKRGERSGAVVDSSPPPDADVGATHVQDFVVKLVGILEDSEARDVARWLETGGDGFRIEKLSAFATRMGYLKTSSLLRQLSVYGFKTLWRGSGVFRHKHGLFHRERPDLLPRIVRRVVRARNKPKTSSKRALAARGLIDLTSA